MNFIITGTSRGIGLELCLTALARGHNVCAVAREPSASTGLKKLAQEYGAKLVSVGVDVTQPNSISKVLEAVKGWTTVDTLINNAGVFEKDDNEKAFLRSFQVNSMAPFLFTEALLPNLQKSARPLAVHITSKMGSIADNTSGGYHAYRASKAALNMLNKGIAIENPWLTAIVVHPGWVQTDMGGAGAPTTISESVQGIWQVIEKAQKSQSGSFLDFKGHTIPW